VKTVFISATWSDTRANHNVREWDTEADAKAAVDGTRNRLEASGCEPVGFTVQPKTRYASACKSYNYRRVSNGIIEIVSTGYWSQIADDSDDSDRNPGHCEAAYRGAY